MNKILLSIAKWLLVKSAEYIWNFIDKDKDGKISQEELASVVLVLKSLTKKTKQIKEVRK